MKTFKLELKILRYYDAQSFKVLFDKIVEEFGTNETDILNVDIKEYGKAPKKLHVITIQTKPL